MARYRVHMDRTHPISLRRAQTRSADPEQRSRGRRLHSSLVRSSIDRFQMERATMSEAIVDQNNAWRLESPGATGWQRTARADDPNKFFIVSADCHVQEPN